MIPREQKNTVNINAEQIFETLEKGDSESSLDLAAELFIHSGDFHRLFEVRKLQGRRRLGLPAIAWGKREVLEPELREQLDRELLTACRETAELWLAKGNLPAAWPYLEPLDDRAWVQAAIESLTVDSDNIETLIEHAFHRGGHPLHGFRLILKHSGTCNAITLMDSASPYLARELRTSLASELADHFYGELLKNLTAAGNTNPPTERDQSWRDVAKFIQAVENRDPRLSNGPHIDATHLHSVTRIGQVVSDIKIVEQLYALSLYGEQLAPMFHFPGQPPFESHFFDSVWFYRGLLGIQVEEAISHFEKKLASSRGTELELVVCETVVDWLIRLGRLEQAVETALTYSGNNFGELGISPNLIEAVQKDSEVAARLASHFRKQGDVLSHLLVVLVGRK